MKKTLECGFFNFFFSWAPDIYILYIRGGSSIYTQGGQ